MKGKRKETQKELLMARDWRAEIIFANLVMAGYNEGTGPKVISLKQTKNGKMILCRNHLASPSPTL